LKGDIEQMILQDFTVTIESECDLPDIKINNLAELIFSDISFRDEDSIILISHINETIFKITLKQLRLIVASLYEEFENNNIHVGDTVLLATLFVNNELLTALLLISLISYGVRVFFPMFVETSELEEWLKITNTSCIVYPKIEVESLGIKYSKEKRIIEEIESIARRSGISTYDVNQGFNTLSLINQKNHYSDLKTILIYDTIKNTNLETEAVIFTTSGTTGRSKLVVYSQGGFIRNCYSWQASGMYDQNKLGGRSIVDILPHTISIRSLFNALWTGYPICILTSDWILRHPQKTLPIIMEMKPETITLGPSSIDFLLESVKLIPEIKKTVFQNLKTIVSTGAYYNDHIADTVRNIFGIKMHNAYGTTETQQVLSTLLDNKIKTSGVTVLGKPYPGVIIGLKELYKNVYMLYVKSPFGCKYYLDLDTKKQIVPSTFFNTGDLVSIDENENIFYIGREKKDFIKSGYGAKVPLSFMKETYNELYKRSDHIEYYPGKISPISSGITALIFINKSTLPTGVITNKSVIHEYSTLILKINKKMKDILEPFEFDQRSIKKFLLINEKAPRTKKKTISHFALEQMYKNEISLLKNTYKSSYGVHICIPLTQKIANILYSLFVFKNPILKKWWHRKKK